MSNIPGPNECISDMDIKKKIIERFQQNIEISSREAHRDEALAVKVCLMNQPINFL